MSERVLPLAMLLSAFKIHAVAVDQRLEASLATHNARPRQILSVGSVLLLPLGDLSIAPQYNSSHEAASHSCGKQASPEPVDWFIRAPVEKDCAVSKAGPN